jgi:hypothetical protein
MKTLHTLSAVITLSISTFSHAENTTPQNENSLTISVLEVKKPTCNGAANASILIEVNGGTLPYHYNWNTFPAQSSPMATNLTKGIYFIQVTDANGLVTYKSIEITDPINTIVNPIAISSLVSQSVTVICERENEAFTYYLDGQKIEEPVVTGLDIGIHKLTITNQNDCTVEQFIQIIELESDSINSEKNKTEIVVSSLITTDEFNTITLMQHK